MVVGSTPNLIVVYHHHNDVDVNTETSVMSIVRIYDIRGRMLLERKDINESETRINLVTTNQVLLAHVNTTVGLKVTKKVVN